MLPTSWKLGRITPIPKGTNKSLPSCYRPISVLPVASKLIECHIKAWQLLKNLYRYVLQFLQASGVSCPTGLLCQCSLEFWMNDNVLWIKVTKYALCFWCLQSIWHCVSLTIAPKIEWNWSGPLSHKVDQRLTRSQLVSIDGCNSATLPVLSGVPWGLVLGPLLFVTYINNVATAISSDSDVNMFADNSALYRVIRTRVDYIHLQEDVISVYTCIGQKFLHFNTNKYKLMLITRKRANSLPPHPFTLNGTGLSKVSSYKYLGVTISSDLS